MALSKIQEIYQELAKNRYDEMSNSSRSEVLDWTDFIHDFTIEYCIEYLKIPIKSIPSPEPINESIVNSLLKSSSLGSLKVLNYYFLNINSYTSTCLSVLDLLAPEGIAVIYIPNRIFEKVKSDLEGFEFFINGIFGFKDDRDTTYDKEKVLPLDCKYIGLWVTKTKSEQLFIWTESDLYQFFLDEEDGDQRMALFHSIFSSGAKRTSLNKSYQILIGGAPILYPRKELITLEYLYYTLESASIPKLEFHNIKDKKLKDFSQDYANSAFETEILLQCFKGDDGLVFDDAKFTKAKKHAKRDFLGFTKTSFYKEIKKYLRVESTHPPNKNLANVNDFIIIETVDYDYSPLSYSFYHPSEWTWSEFKNWQSVDAEIKVCAIKIDTDKVLIDFLLHFLRSSYGDIQLKLASFNQRKHIFGIVEKDYSWKDIAIPLPEIHDQKVIVSALNKTKNINERIQMLETNLLTNPINAQEADAELKDMISRLQMISDTEKILQLIEKRGRENTTVELKQTLRLDIETNRSEKYLETSALKTIPAFMNTDGGILLIGVSDDGEVTGMDHEIEQFHKDSQDNFKLWFGRLLATRIGKEFISKVEFELVLVKEKYVLKVECEAIKEGNGCYLDGKVFYVRRHAYTEPLEGSDLVKYSKEHFA